MECSNLNENEQIKIDDTDLNDSPTVQDLTEFERKNSIKDESPNGESTASKRDGIWCINKLTIQHLISIVINSFSRLQEEDCQPLRFDIFEKHSLCQHCIGYNICFNRGQFFFSSTINVLAR